MKRVTGGYNIAHRGFILLLILHRFLPGKLAPWKRVAAAEKEDEHVLTKERFEFTRIFDHRGRDFDAGSAYYILLANGRKRGSQLLFFSDKRRR